MPLSQLNKIKRFWPVIFIAAVLFINWLAWQARRDLVFSPYESNPLSNFTVCTGIVKQPDCQEKSSAEITIRWQFNSPGHTSTQTSSRVQIDEAEDFSSPDYDSGETANTENYFTFEKAGFLPEKKYYWRIDIADNNGQWTGWLRGEDPFVLNPYCPAGNE